MRLALKIWRQKDQNSKGSIHTYHVEDISPEASFLEMLDILNEQLVRKNEEPVAFDHDCREGICGTCSLYINGRAHGPDTGITTCQLHMRAFNDGESIYIEPFRAKSFKVLKDLIVDRSPLDRIQQSGAYINVRTTDSQIDANTIAIDKESADKAFDAASCIGCGACIASCKNSSAMLFVSARVAQYSFLPQGEIGMEKRIDSMVNQMEKEDFGSCTNIGSCEVDCPKGISLNNISILNKKYLLSLFKKK